MLHPWYFNEYDEEMFRFYSQLRYSLIPYIYSAAINSSLTGMPIVRPMPLIYPDDKNTEEMLKEYMFGENLLVGAFTDSVYLPEGNWIDYWTGKEYSGKQHFKYKIPKGRGGFLFVRSGAIIPYQKPQQYISIDFPDTLIVRFYPDGNSGYTLLEDDGISYKYEEGIVAKTIFTCAENDNLINLEIKPDTTNYSEELKNRVYELELFCKEPKRVTLNTPAKETIEWKYDSEKSKLSFSINTNSVELTKIEVIMNK
jgi:alpha-glucosidase (family GH31 glycosyl hydrolase)